MNESTDAVEPAGAVAAAGAGTRPRTLRELTILEARVLGVLIEKERTVPDTYPLTLNALVAGCNQKSNRNPVLDTNDAHALAAVEALKGLSLVIESSGGRVMRYAQNVKRVLQVPTEAVALLATLVLRGPQTVAELRANSERLCRISDASAVEAFLQELAARPAGALTVELPRQPGSRENRWMHRLCGDAGLPVAAAAAAGAAPAIDLPEVQAEVAAVLARYGQALADGDAEAMAELLWQSPKALLVDARRNAASRVESAAYAVLRTQLVCFGRDYAASRVELRAGDAAPGVTPDPAPARCESQAWVRFAQGWRIVAAS